MKVKSAMVHDNAFELKLTETQRINALKKQSKDTSHNKDSKNAVEEQPAKTYDDEISRDKIIKNLEEQLEAANAELEERTEANYRIIDKLDAQLGGNTDYCEDAEDMLDKLIAEYDKKSTDRITYELAIRDRLRFLLKHEYLMDAAYNVESFIDAVFKK